MKSFYKFLKENKVDDFMGLTEGEIYSVVDGESLVKEDMDFDDLSLDEIADMNMNDPIDEDEEDTNGGIATGFGGEEYVSLDAPSLVEPNKPTSESESKNIKKTDETKKSKLPIQDEPDDIEISVDDQDKLLNFRIDADGRNLLKKDESGKWVPLTQTEIDEIVTRTNTEGRYDKKSHYEVSPDGTIYTVNNEDPSKRRILGKWYRQSVLKRVNDKVDALGKHFQYKGDSATLQINKTEYANDGTTGNKQFDRLEYGDLTRSDIDLVLKYLNPSKSDKPKVVVGYKDGQFTRNDVPMTDRQFRMFVKLLNGQVGDTTKLLNPKAWGKKVEDYWKSYKISIAGSKVGKAINFNLPPGPNGSCRSEDLPCTKECYAMKAYAMYPAVKAAADCNFKLLQKDTNFNLFKKSMMYALTAPMRGGKGNRFNLCRIHVSGDFYSVDYLRAICDIARACGHIKFWAYTKQYEILSEVGKGSIPKNLCIIVSCWGKFNPFFYKDGKYAHLAKDFPLAYLDDGSDEYREITEETQKLLGKPKDVQYCPCTTADQIITRCETCRICFDRIKASDNLIFKEH